MIVKYFAYFRKDAGCKEETLLLAPLTALELLRKLADIHGQQLRSSLLTTNQEEIHQDVIFLIDGRNIDFINGKESVIQENAVVSLFPRVAGG
jgi:molybdopterin converting factor small subunit